MSKLSFRARQVDYTKPLPIYLNNDLPDLQDIAAINRAVPQMPTGMEKDEEAEHHLQRALSAIQAFGATSSSQEYAIPTPKVEIDNKLYDRIYNVEYTRPKQYIRIQPFSSDFDYPDFDADYDDEIWLQEQNKSLPSDFTSDLTLFFETVMDKLEKATGYSTNIISLEEAKILLFKDNNDENDYLYLTSTVASLTTSSSSSALTTNNNTTNNTNDANNNLNNNLNKYKKEREEFILKIYEYWKEKRLKLNHPLTPIVLTDKSGVVTQPNNPFLVFRRRTEKMQTRKNRKTEEQSYEKMLILKRDLNRALQIFKLMRQREILKKESLKQNIELLEKRFKANDYDGALCESIKCSLKPALTSNGLLIQYGSQQQQSGNSKSIEGKLKTIGGSSVAFKKLNSANSFNDELYKSNLNKFSHHLTEKQLKYQQQLNNSLNKMKKDKQFLSSSHLNNKFQEQNNQNKLKHQLQNSQNTNKASIQNINSINLNKTSFYQTNRSQNEINSLSMKRKRFTNNESSLNNTISNLNECETAEKNQAITSPAIDMNELKKSLCQKFNIDISELNLCSNYEEQLKLNDINENLDTILSETCNKLSTSNEKDGYWCFKRKEGCKYLAAQNVGSIFKNDPFDIYENTKLIDENNDEETSPKKKSIKKPKSFKEFDYQFLKSSSIKNRIKSLNCYYYGYAITNQNRHLGLVRRRLGRGGRILFDKFHNNFNLIKNDVIDRDIFENNEKNPLNNFKTFYPKECFKMKNINNNQEKNDNQTAAGLQSSPTSNIAVVPNKKNKKLALKKLVLTSDNEFCFNSKNANENFGSISSSSDEELEEEQDDLNELFDSSNDSNKLIYDHRLFPIYQLNQLDNNNNNKDANSKNIINQISLSNNAGVDSELNYCNLLDDENNKNKLATNLNNHYLNDNDTMLLSDSTRLFDYEEDMSDTSTNKDGSNYVKLDLTSSTTLNSEYQFKSNQFNLNMPNLKFAFKTLCVPKLKTKDLVGEKFPTNLSDSDTIKSIKIEPENVNNTSDNNTTNQDSLKIENEVDNKTITSPTELQIANKPSSESSSNAKAFMNGISSSISALQAVLLKKQLPNNNNVNTNIISAHAKPISNHSTNDFNSTSTSSVPSSSSSSSSPSSSPTALNKLINTGSNNNSNVIINGINGTENCLIKKKDENTAQMAILDSIPSTISFNQALNPNNEVNINYNSNQNHHSSKNNELKLSSQHQLIDNTNLNNYLDNKVVIVENNNNVNASNNNNSSSSSSSNSSSKVNDSNVSSSFLAAQAQTQLANNGTASENKNLPMEVT